jgi:CheY-like chemotaxis protein/HPt (histidine-containing phosphotransfer) domain-containing protein
VLLIQFHISDTGIGMNLEEARRVLAPFEQGTSNARRRHGGVGLGLAIAHRLVTHMGGTLEIASLLGKGTSIRVNLPLSGVDAPRREAALTSERSQPSTTGGRALIVDDSAPARELLRAMLELSGWQTAEASRGSEAQRMLAVQDFDLVLLDYQMPDADGAETAVALRRLSQTRRSAKPIHIYLLTANLFAHEQLGQLDALNGVLAKPLSRAALLALLAEIEGRSPSHTRLGKLDSDLAPPELSPLDPHVLEDLRALTGRDGTPVLARVVEQTRSAQGEQLRALSEAIRQGEWRRAAKEAHGVAGQAAVVGARHVANAARALQSRLEQGEQSSDVLLADLETMIAAWRTAEHALQEEAKR